MPPKGKKSVFDNIQGIEDTLQGTPSDITNYGDKTDTTAQNTYGGRGVRTYDGS